MRRLLLCLACLACDGPAPSGPTVGGESHFLEACNDAACGEGLACICGVCTRTCEAGGCGDDALCFTRDAAALICSPEPAICLPRCAEGAAGICAADDGLQLPDPLAQVPPQYVTLGEITGEALPAEVAEIEQVVFSPPDTPSGEIVLYLPKARSRAVDSSTFLAAAALDGHFAFGLSLVERAPCAAEDPVACWGEARRAACFGAIQPPYPARWQTPDSILFRADRLIAHQASRDARLAALLPDGAVDWTRVHLVAHRDAAPLALEIARALPVASVGILAGPLVDVPAELPGVAAPSTALRFAIRADDPDREAIVAQWTDAAGARPTPWGITAPRAEGTAWIVEPAGIGSLEGTFDSLLLDQRLDAEQVHALRPLWRHLIGAGR